MQKVPFDKLLTWQTTNGYRMPSSIDCICGFCNILACLQTKYSSRDDQLESIFMAGRCTHCDQISKIWIFPFKTEQQWKDNNRECECWIYPKAEIRNYKFTERDINSERILRAYREAIDTFNEGRPISSINSCGRIVEGIAKTNFPNVGSTNQIGRLFTKLKSESEKLSPEFTNLLSPLSSLGEALRIGRNTAGHFDFEKEPDKNLANKILDLTEFLMQYVYTLDSEAANVEKLILELDPQEP
jgi:hypothetical protein